MTTAPRAAVAALGVLGAVLAVAASGRSDGIDAVLAGARTEVSRAMDTGWVSALPPRDGMLAMAGVRDRLDGAAAAAADVLAARPASWEAAMMLGAARYLEAAYAQEAATAGRRAAWAAPLRLARTLAPAEPEPERFTALAALECLPAMTAAERAEARETIRRAFADPDTLRRGLPAWLVHADSRSEALRGLADTMATWGVVEDHLGRARDWAGAADARGRWYRAAAREAAGWIADLDERVRHGDADGAQALAARVLAALPPDRRFGALAARALESAPPRPADAAGAGAAGRWLRWALDGYAAGIELLPPAAVRRLAVWAAPLPPPLQALADLAAGNAAAAEAIAREHDALTLEAWAPYCLATARARSAQGRPGEALELLRRISRACGGTPSELAVRAEAAGRAGAVEVRRDAERELAGMAAAPRPGSAWQWRDGVPRVEVVASGAAPCLTVGVDVAPAAGAVVEVRVDFELAAVAAVREGESVTLDRALPAGVHTVELKGVAGGRVAPGEVTLCAS